MARETIIKLTDDIDGSEAVEEVGFALRGVEYEIDLNAKNVAALEKALDKFVNAGRRIPRARTATRRTVSTAPARSGNVGEIREWAQANGFTISARGRIPHDVRNAFEAAQG